MNVAPISFAVHISYVSLPLLGDFVRAGRGQEWDGTANEHSVGAADDCSAFALCSDVRELEWTATAPVPWCATAAATGTTAAERLTLPTVLGSSPATS
ncbi:hypothetical protein [Jatrophihabitans endophyticus]|uniref:hypothetical protein n=1 Tax=Jatrophihabitans endophyticus TaxID=1206085 RepID=UPI0013566BE5|nr:hypothetical protein [Jatrophihabitans endophyticus]